MQKERFKYTRHSTFITLRIYNVRNLLGELLRECASYLSWRYHDHVSQYSTKWTITYQQVEPTQAWAKRTQVLEDRDRDLLRRRSRELV